MSPHFLFSLSRSRIVRIAVRIAISLVSLIRLGTCDRGPAVHGVRLSLSVYAPSHAAPTFSDSHFPSLLHISRVLLLHSQHKAVLQQENPNSTNQVHSKSLLNERLPRSLFAHPLVVTVNQQHLHLLQM